MADEAPAEAAPTTPETASEIPATTPEAVTAPVSTTLPAEEPSNDAGKGAGGVEGYLADKKKAMAPKVTPAPAEAAPAVAAEEIVPAAAAAPVVPVTEPAAPEAAVPAASAPPTDEVEEEKTPDRLRIGAVSDGHLIVAATNIARKEKITFAEAFERVKPKPAEAVPATETQTSSLRARNLVEADLAAAREERRTAAKSADALEAGAAGKMVEAEEKIENLRAELDQIGGAESRAEQDRQTSEKRQFSAGVSESKGKAVQYWPDSGVVDSDFSKRMLELSDKYEADPDLKHHVYEADAPFFFAKLVAQERGELPAHLRKKETAAPAAAPAATQPSTSPATKPAAVVQRAVVSPAQLAAGPASGAARTTQEAPKVDFGIDKIRSVADYDRVKKKLLTTAK